MCGIFGYNGNEPAGPILLEGLRKLEYRGYDSAGIALQENNTITCHKKQGEVSNLKKTLPRSKATLGIAHTRWATHGQPSVINAHPHVDCTKSVYLVHNGIIENADTLRSYLKEKGHVFQSETDTEVLVHLIEEQKKTLSLYDAIRNALDLVKGTYGIAVLSTGADTLICACNGSPLIIGKSDHATFLSSDIAALAKHTDNFYVLKEKELAVLEKNNFFLIDKQKNKTTPQFETLQWKVETIEKGKHEHFMMKEILEQPESLRNCIRGRLQPDKVVLSLNNIDLSKVERITLLGCGTSWHAGLVAKYFMSALLKIPATVEYASEFRYATPVLGKEDLVIAISQSGETADTLAALKEAKKYAPTIGIVNTVGSTIARAVDAGVYIHAGPEIGVASTKAFTGQILALMQCTLHMALQKKSIDVKTYTGLYKEMNQLPDILQALLTPKFLKKIEQVAKTFTTNNALFLGRGSNFPTALEGALKLKEISYIHAEGYPAAEMKHGPIALIDKYMPVVVVASHNGTYEKMVSNIQEVKARNGKIVTIASQQDPELKRLSDHIIYVPQVHDFLSPIINVIPLQLLAYYAAVGKGLNPDKPRNLAKSVTVE